MALRKNLPQLRQRFFRAVFLIAREQDDMLALARSVAAGVGHPLVLGESESRKESDGGERGEELHIAMQTVHGVARQAKSDVYSQASLILCEAFPNQARGQRQRGCDEDGADDFCTTRNDESAA